MKDRYDFQEIRDNTGRRTGNMKCYSLDNSGRVPYGVSCFVLHNVPKSNHATESTPCYFLPPRILLPDGLACVYTHVMELRFPDNIQRGWHFNIFPTKMMSIDEFVASVRGLNWTLCNIKAAALPDELVCIDNDDNGLDVEMVWIYNLLIDAYAQTKGTMNRLHINDVHTWIATHKPSFQDLINDDLRTHWVSLALAEMKVEDCTTMEIRRTDILARLGSKFGKKRASTGSDLQQYSDPIPAC